MIDNMYSFHVFSSYATEETTCRRTTRSKPLLTRACPVVVHLAFKLLYLAVSRLPTSVARFDSEAELCTISQCRREEDVKQNSCSFGFIRYL